MLTFLLKTGRKLIKTNIVVLPKNSPVSSTLVNRQQYSKFAQRKQTKVIFRDQQYSRLLTNKAFVMIMECASLSLHSLQNNDTQYVLQLGIAGYSRYCHILFQSIFHKSQVCSYGVQKAFTNCDTLLNLLSDFTSNMDMISTDSLYTFATFTLWKFRWGNSHQQIRLEQCHLCQL